MSVEPVTAAVMIIGDEILSGRTPDANFAVISAYLAARGVEVTEGRIVGDTRRQIVETLNLLRSAHDYVVTTGGIGPTHDDITAECVAEAFGVELRVDEGLVASLAALWKVDASAVRRMSRLPAGAQLVDNSLGGAPGFQLENVFVLAGIPKVARAMLDDVGPRLRCGRVAVSETVRVQVRGESIIAEVLEAVASAHPELSLGSYPYFGDSGSGAELVVRGFEAAAVRHGVRELVAGLLAIGVTAKAT